MRSLCNNFSVGRGYKAIVARCACRCPKVCSYSPRNCVPCLVFFPRQYDIPMFALRVYIPGRHVGLKMTLRTCERFSSNFDRETMARVACCARTETSVRILTSHTLIGPVGKIGYFDIPDTCRYGLYSLYIYFCSMASVAGFVFCRGGGISMMHGRSFNEFYAVDDLKKGLVYSIVS